MIRLHHISDLHVRGSVKHNEVVREKLDDLLKNRITLDDVLTRSGEILGRDE
ncbi:MAG: hypothetical protein ABIH41_01435 [Nanoarchaeota archaeon]